MSEGELWLPEKKEILFWQVITPKQQPENSSKITNNWSVSYSITLKCKHDLLFPSVVYMELSF